MHSPIMEKIVMAVSRSNFIRSILMGGGMTFLGGSAAFNTDSTSVLSVKELITIWQASAQMALEFAEVMPEEKYTFRPADNPELYTYGGQMLHIAGNIRSLVSRYVTERPAPDIPVSAEGASKAAIMKAMQQCFDYGERAIQEQTEDSLRTEVDFFAGPLSRRHVLFVVQDHTTHHLGQAVIYLRGNGITPPDYRKWG